MNFLHLIADAITVFTTLSLTSQKKHYLRKAIFATVINFLFAVIVNTIIIIHWPIYLGIIMIAIMIVFSLLILYKR
ncbi:hypothetical protein [Pectinatus sottacetonis]|uniref:hypothetical protein n=1 Tax=Pectinatus sottacetonis TaxID=1002795 RepID=UPI0018C82C81|nr:hypothetical protein [Pectinatus sottacetonis]